MVVTLETVLTVKSWDDW